MKKEGRKDKLFRATVKRQMTLNNISMESLSRMLNVGLSTMYAKLNNLDSLTVRQLKMLRKTLKLTDEDIKNIF